MIVRPIGQLPAVYLEEPRSVAVCNASADQMEWMLVTWDPVMSAWFVGSASDFIEFIQNPTDGQYLYLPEATHFFELPDLPRRVGVH